MKKIISVFLALTLILAYMPADIFTMNAKAESETYVIKPTDDTWAGYSTEFRNVIQGVKIDGEDSNIYNRLYSIGASADGDLSTKVYNSSPVYMKYDLSDISNVKIKSAKLKLYGKCLNNVSVNNIKMFFFKIDNKWSENTLIHGDTPFWPLKGGVPSADFTQSSDPSKIQPDLVSPVFSMSASSEEFELKEFDVTTLLSKYNLMEDSTVSFAYMVYPTSYVFNVVSKDADETDMHPVLEIETEPIPDFEAVSGPEGEIEFDSPVSVSFTNNVDKNSVDASKIHLYEDGEEIEISDDDIDVCDNVITVSTPLAGYCDYSLVISDGIFDIYQNQLISEAEYTFSTVGVHTETVYTHTEADSSVPQGILNGAFLKSGASNLNNTRVTDTGRVQIMAGGSAYYIYCVEADLTTLDTSVPFASFIYSVKFHTGAGQKISVIELDDFDPETVTYGSVSENVDSGEIIISNQALGDCTGGKYVDFDLTEFVNKKIAEGETVIRFAMKPTVKHTTNFYSNFAGSAHRPKAKVIFNDDSFTGVKESVPCHAQNGVDVSAPLSVTFSVPMESVTYENFALTNLNDSTQITFGADDVVYDDVTLIATVTPPESLDELTPYELAIFGASSLKGEVMKNKKIKFITGSSLEIGEIVLDDDDLIDEGEQIMASVDVSNNTDSSLKSPTLIIALYKGAVMVDYALGTSDELTAQSSATLEAALAVKPDSDLYDQYYVKAFLWDSLDGQRIMAESVTGESASEDYENGKFFGVVTADGGFANSSEKQVTIVAKNEAGEICYINQVTADEKGKFSAELGFEQSGNYSVYAMSEAAFAKAPAIEIDSYTSYDDYLDVWEAINSENKTKIASVLTKAVEIFDFDEINYSIEHITDLISADIKEYGDFGSYSEDNISEFYDFLKESSMRHFKVSELLSDIADAENYTLLTDILGNEENATYLQIDKHLSKYRDNKKKINKALVGRKFDSLEDFVEAFEDALDDALDKDDKDSGGGVSVSKGNSGSSTVYTGTTVTTPPQSEPMQTPSDSAASDNLILQEENYFTDSSTVPWAQKEIEFLYRMGVISGRGERTYAPNDNVLREEFVKLIVETVEADTKNAKSDFEDVSKDFWCYPYVSAAYSNKIVNGISDKKFGVGTDITRQDICVMIARTLELMGFTAKSEKEASFGDMALVSDYAKNAVAYLGEIGIITGTPDGKFNPKANATRAETALIIFRTMDYIKTNGATLYKPDSSNEPQT